jgi:CRP/FNR family transcriptional regulator, cyclic AMP receptor protein
MQLHEIPTIAYVFGFIGAALTAVSFLMRSMLPLRLVALVASLFMVVYGWLAAALPTMLLYVAMIGINAKKAWDIHKVLRAMEEARSEIPLKEWLLPHMKRRPVKAGTVLWRQGDPANEMVFVEKGKLRIEEYGEFLGEGTLVGEIGIFASDHRRTLTLVCETDCVLHRMTSEAMMQLYYLSPKLGFEIMRLVVARLQRDVETWRAKAHASHVAQRLAAGATADGLEAHEDSDTAHSAGAPSTPGATGATGASGTPGTPTPVVNTAPPTSA